VADEDPSSNSNLGIEDTQQFKQTALALPSPRDRAKGNRLKQEPRRPSGYGGARSQGCFAASTGNTCSSRSTGVR
jgi:hypothetical protein